VCKDAQQGWFLAGKDYAKGHDEPALFEADEYRGQTRAGAMVESRGGEAHAWQA